MSLENRQLQLGVVLNAEGVAAGVNDIKNQLAGIPVAAEQAAQGTNKSLANLGGGNANTNIERISTAFNGVTDSVKKMVSESDRGLKAFVTQIQSSAASAGKVTQAIADKFEARAILKGFDPAIVQPYITGLRQLADENQRLKEVLADEAKVQRQATQATAEAAAQFNNFKTSAQAARIELLSFGKAASEKYQIRAELLGIDKQQAVQQIITDLKAAEAAALAAGKGVGATLAPALQGAALQGKALNAALRQVPAQFTDIVVSLQGGQAPLTVLLQQGGQLKDVFGGIGPAAQALGGYVKGLINPFTLAAAAAAGLAFAYKLGSDEADAYNRALILSGNSAGVTAGQLQVMAQRISEVRGTTGAAAESLAAFAQSGAVSAANLEQVSAAASRFSSVTGTALKDIVSQFAELKKAPLEASLKLNESTNFLTASLYQQIKALEEQGKTTEAANLAQKAFADTLDSQSAAIVAKLGTIERAWAAVKNAIKEAGDALLEVGRSDGLDAQVAGLNKSIAVREGFVTNRVTGKVDTNDSKLKDLIAERDVILESARIEARRVTSAAEQLGIVAARAKFDKEGLQFLDNSVKREREILKVQQEGLAARASKEEIDKRIAQVQEKFKDKALGKSQIADDTKEFAAYIAGLQKRLEKEQELTEVLKAQDFLKSRNFTPQQKELAIELAKQVDLRVAEEVATKAAAKAQEDYVKAQLRTIDAAEKASKSAGDTLQKYLDEEQALTLAAEKNITLAQAIAEVELARLREAQAKAIDSKANLGVLLALDEEIQKREQIAKAIGRKENRDAVKKSAEDAAKEWKKAADQIEQSITDALLRGFESGKGFGENLRDTLENMFKTLVLRPIIQATVQGALGIPGAPGSAGGIPNGGSIGGTSVFGDFGGSVAGGVDKLGQYLINNSGTNQALGDFGASLVSNSKQIGAYAEKAGNILSYLEAASNFKDGSYGSAIGQGIGTYFGGPLGGQIGKGIGETIDKLFSKGEYVKSTGNANIASDALGNVIGRNTETSANFDVVRSQAADAIAAGLQDTYLKTAKSLGIGTVASNFSFGANNSDGGKFSLAGAAGSGSFTQQETAISDTAVKLAASRAVFAALQGSDLPAYLSKVFDGITASTAGQQDIDTALAYAGSLKQIRAALTETRTPLQILKDSVATAFTALGTSADTFKVDFVAAIDAGISPDKLAQYLALGQNLDDLAKASGTASTAVGEVVRSLADIASERKGLQQQLDDLTLTATELLTKQRDGLDESNRALFDQVQAAKTAKDAADDLAQAQADQAQSAIDAAAQLASTNAGLQDRLDVLTGTQTDRSLQLRDATDATTRSLLEQIFAQEDLQAAAERVKGAISGLGSTRFGLENQILTLQGNTGEVATRTRANDLSKLTEGITSQAEIDRITAAYDYNTSLLATIDALTAAKAAAEESSRAQAQAAETSARAAESLKSALQGLTDSIFDEVKRIRGLIGGSSAQTFAGAQANFSIAAAQASAGDQNALKLLPSLSQTLLTLAEANATSLVQLRAIQGTTAGTLEQIAKKYVSQFGLQVPQFAVGTNYVPQDMLAVVHKGEAIVPAAYNPSNGDGGNNQALIAEMQALRSQIAGLQVAADKTAKTLDIVTRGGRAMQTEAFV